MYSKNVLFFILFQPTLNNLCFDFRQLVLGKDAKKQQLDAPLSLIFFRSK